MKPRNIAALAGAALAVFVAAFVLSASLASLASAAGVHELTVDGVTYAPTKETGGAVHYETPDVSPSSASSERHTWTGNGAEHLPCPAGIHWIDNDNVLTVSHCLEESTPSTPPPTTTPPTTPPSSSPPATDPPATTAPPTTTPPPTAPPSTVAEPSTTVASPTTTPPAPTSPPNVPTTPPAPELPPTGSDLAIGLVAAVLALLGAGLMFLARRPS